MQSIPTHKEGGDNDDDGDNDAVLQAAIIVTNAARRIRLMSKGHKMETNEFRVATQLKKELKFGKVVVLKTLKYQ